jgi:hypothetical protein
MIFKKLLMSTLIILSYISFSALAEEVTSKKISKQPVSLQQNQKSSDADMDDLLNVLVSNDQEKGISSNNLLKKMKKAKIILLNKITAKSEQIELDVGEVKFFGNLSIEVHQCFHSTDPYKPNDLMLLTIFDNKTEDEHLSVFHGWMVTSNPSISTPEHPVYEIIPRLCFNEEKPKTP